MGSTIDLLSIWQGTQQMQLSEKGETSGIHTRQVSVPQDNWQGTLTQQQEPASQCIQKVTQNILK